MRVAGFGFRSTATEASFQAALDLTGVAVDAIATAEAKAPHLKSFAEALALPLISISKAALESHARPGAAEAKARYGTGSVAESAALAAAGPNARLIMSRLTSPDRLAVVAIAEGIDP